MPVEPSGVPRLYRPTECTVTGMLANLALTVGKILVGFLFRSAALVADGVHSFADVISDVAVLLALRTSRRPPDRNHPYGHESFETLGAIAVAVFMIIVGVLIGRDAVMRLVRGENLQPEFLALVAALVSAAIKEGMARYTLKAAHLCHSPALAANGHMHRTDAVTSAGAALGILGAMLGVTWLDSAAALLISLLVLREGLRLARQNVLVLLDTMPDEETVLALREAAGRPAGVLEVRDLMVRQRGSVFFTDVTVAVDPDLSVSAAHDLADAVETTMREEFRELSRVLVHVEPFDPPAVTDRAGSGHPG